MLPRKSIQNFCRDVGSPSGQMGHWMETSFEKCGMAISREKTNGRQ